jgi:hypothetical protein
MTAPAESTEAVPVGECPSTWPFNSPGMTLGCTVEGPHDTHVAEGTHGQIVGQWDNDGNPVYPKTAGYVVAVTNPSGNLRHLTNADLITTLEEAQHERDMWARASTYPQRYKLCRVELLDEPT